MTTTFITSNELDFLHFGKVILGILNESLVGDARISSAHEEGSIFFTVDPSSNSATRGSIDIVTFLAAIHRNFGTGVEVFLSTDVTGRFHFVISLADFPKQPEFVPAPEEIDPD